MNAMDATPGWLMTGWILTVLVLIVPLYVWTSLALAGVFRKCGEDAWKGWVPVLNTWTVLTLGRQPGWWALLLPVPVVNIVAVVMQLMAIDVINRRFGRGSGLTVLAFFFYPVWASVLAWGSGRPAEPRPLDTRVGGAAAFPAPRASADPRAQALFIPAQPGAPTPPPPAMAASGPAPAPAPTPTPTATATLPSGGSPFAPPSAASGASAFPPAPPAPPRPGSDSAGSGAATPVSAPPAPERREPAAPVTAVPHDVWAPRAAAPRAAAPAPVTPAPVTPAPVAPSTPPAPMAASTATSLDEDDERTVIARGRRQPDRLLLPTGEEIDLAADTVVLGRSPRRLPDVPDAQIVAVADTTKTVSKSHAVLRREADGWSIEDLHSTNGVVLIDETGGEHEPVGRTPVTGRFLLGDAEFRLSILR